MEMKRAKKTGREAEERSISVLKFGSSVLRGEEDFEEAVHEIYRCVRRGERVVAVVSAMGNTTDSLVELGARFDGGSPGAAAGAYATLLSVGELTSVALLTLALERVGVSAEALGVHQWGLRTQGDPLDADPVAMREEVVEEALARRSVVVVPGFLGCGPGGEPTLLGRGGSDLTALFLADRLKAGRCVLLKDQPGVFEKDPRRWPGARRYRTLSFLDALNNVEEVIAPKALQFAMDTGRAFVVRRCGDDGGTTVGAARSSFEGEAAAPRPLRVALLGLGTVGWGVYRALRGRPEEFEVVGIGVRDPRRHVEAGIREELLFTDLNELLEAEVDVVVALLGGVEPGLTLIRDSLRRGRHVVTANKAVIAAHGAELERVATEAGATLSYSASVGGGAPVLELLDRLKWEAVVGIEGVLNGTTNYILEQLAEGACWGGAIREAQERGFAEEDPTLDLDGTDAASKLAIALRRGTGQWVELESMPVEGIEGLSEEAIRDAREQGECIRLVASYSAEGTGWVRPLRLASESLLGEIREEWNRLVVHLKGGTSLRVEGKGAGRWPTAESVVADLMDVARAARG